MDEILKLAPLEERIYRHRCVEAWSIVVPWIGYSFSTIGESGRSPLRQRNMWLLKAISIRSRCLLGERRASICLTWKVCGLDEAMNPLALLCVGMYGDNASQSGWRSGAHGASLEIRIQEHQVDREDPLRERPASHNLEYNERPRIWLLFECESDVDHPRWSQAHEHRLGGVFDRPILR